jgi:hypothetical protein
MRSSVVEVKCAASVLWGFLVSSGCV